MRYRRRRRKSFVWQRIIVMGLVSAAVSFVVSPILSGQLTKPAFTEFKQEQTKSAPGNTAVAAKLQKPLQSQLLDGGEEAATRSLLSKVPAQFQGATVYTAKISGPDKVIALTFDDGPSAKYTEQVLDILKQHNIKATFFWVGKMVQEFPQIAQKVVAEGHAIGNHTWHHWYRQMDPATAASEVDRTAAVIYKTTGVTTSMFRPPGGFLRNGVADYAKKHNYVIVMWSDQAGEFKRSASAQTLINNVINKAKSGDIVLLHDGGGNHKKTVQALPEIIAGLEQRGYRFVTVPEMLEMQQREQPLTASSTAHTTVGHQATFDGEQGSRGDGGMR